MVQYACWRESGQPGDWRQSQLLRQIRDYNEDDCQSTWQLVEWLRHRQKEHNVPYVPLAEPVSEEVEADEGQRPGFPVEPIIRDRLGGQRDEKLAAALPADRVGERALEAHVGVVQRRRRVKSRE